MAKLSYNYSYPFVLPYGQVLLRMGNTPLPSGVGSNRELMVGIPIHENSLRNTNSDTFSFSPLRGTGN